MGLFVAYPVLRKAIVNLKGGTVAFEGLIWARKGGYLVLRDTERLIGRGERVPVDGEVVVPVTNIEYLQLVG